MSFIPDKVLIREIKNYLLNPAQKKYRLSHQTGFFLDVQLKSYVFFGLNFEPEAEMGKKPLWKTLYFC